MVINVSNMAGNTFLNLFLLGLVEGPGNLLGMVLAEKVGRRWTHSGLLFINAVFFAIVMGLTQYQYTTWWGSGVIAFLCMWLKMNISATFVVAYIQVFIKVHDSIILYLLSYISIVGDGGVSNLCSSIWYWFLYFHFTDYQHWRSILHCPWCARS